MGRNKLSKALEKVAREKGLIGDEVQKSQVRFTIPPSVNALYFNKRGVGRVKTPDYSKWIKANSSAARTLRPPAKYPVRFCYKLCGKINRSRDGDNVSKAIQDILVAEKVLEKDSLMCVTGGRWEYAPSDDDPHVIVWLEEIE